MSLPRRPCTRVRSAVPFPLLPLSIRAIQWKRQRTAVMGSTTLTSMRQSQNCRSLLVRRYMLQLLRSCCSCDVAVWQSGRQIAWTSLVSLCIDCRRRNLPRDGSRLTSPLQYSAMIPYAVLMLLLVRRSPLFLKRNALSSDPSPHRARLGKSRWYRCSALRHRGIRLVRLHLGVHCCRPLLRTAQLKLVPRVTRTLSFTQLTNLVRVAEGVINARVLCLVRTGPMTLLSTAGTVRLAATRM